MIWRRPQTPFAGHAPQQPQQPFRADWAGWTLMNLLDIRWNGQRPERDVLGAGYRWQAPALPVAVESFER